MAIALCVSIAIAVHGAILEHVVVDVLYGTLIAALATFVLMQSKWRARNVVN
jgi:hypothetical protein